MLAKINNTTLSLEFAIVDEIGVLASVGGIDQCSSTISLMVFNVTYYS